MSVEFCTVQIFVEFAIVESFYCEIILILILIMKSFIITTIIICYHCHPRYEIIIVYCDITIVMIYITHSDFTLRSDNSNRISKHTITMSIPPKKYPNTQLQCQ